MFLTTCSWMLSVIIYSSHVPFMLLLTSLIVTNNYIHMIFFGYLVIHHKLSLFGPHFLLEAYVFESSGSSGYSWIWHLLVRHCLKYENFNNIYIFKKSFPATFMYLKFSTHCRWVPVKRNDWYWIRHHIKVGMSVIVEILVSVLNLNPGFLFRFLCIPFPFRFKLLMINDLSLLTILRYYNQHV